MGQYADSQLDMVTVLMTAWYSTAFVDHLRIIQLINYPLLWDSNNLHLFSNAFSTAHVMCCQYGGMIVNEEP